MKQCCRQGPLALLMSHPAFTDCLQLDEGNALEQSQAQRCRARIEHLHLNLGDKDTQRTWANARVDRILVDYMLRNSYYDTAVKYAEATRIKVRRNKYHVLKCQLCLPSPMCGVPVDLPNGDVHGERHSKTLNVLRISFGFLIACKPEVKHGPGI